MNDWRETHGLLEGHKLVGKRGDYLILPDFNYGGDFVLYWYEDDEGSRINIEDHTYGETIEELEELAETFDASSARVFSELRKL